MKCFVREFHATQNGMLNSVFAIATYSALAFLSMSLADRWLDGSCAATIGLFTLFATVFEMLRSQHHTGARRWCYVVCLLCLCTCGLLMIDQAVAMQGVPK